MQKPVERKLTNFSVLIISSVTVVAGAALLLWSAFGFTTQQVAWAAFISQLGGLLAATGLVTFAWELRGRRQFADETMALAGLSQDLKRAGIVRVANQYLEDQELWNDLFRDVHKLDILVAYASTWRNAHRARLEAVARNPSARIRIFLPDPGDDPTIQNLAHRFSTEPEDLKRKIREAIRDFEDLRRTKGAKVDVFLRTGDLVYSCYRFDSQAVITLYSHARKRQSQVPMFLVRQGDLFDFVYQDLTAIAAESRPVRAEDRS